MKKITAVVLGAGSRGRAYAEYARQFPEELAIVAVAEPNEERRKQFAQRYGISEDMQFTSYEELLSRPRLADAAFICTMDRMHTEPAIKALELKYHVLLEKPMSTTKEECIQIEKAAQRSDRVLSVCHVLRYTSFYQTLKRLIEEGYVGEVCVIDQIENVCYWHQAHSFVRGNWRNSKESSPMILQKSCHDMDIILWLMGEDCLRLSSFGSLRHFCEANAPSDAPDNCMEGCPHSEECPYYAPKIYLNGNKEWPVDVVTTDLSEEGIRKALKEGPYGRCVYRCDNDVVDRQVVNMEFGHGKTAVFTMTAFTARGTRIINIMGTKGQITADMSRKEIILQRFGKEPEIIPLDGTGKDDGFGHGGGDFGIVNNFIHLIWGDLKGDNRTSASISLQSHLMCFAAEEARKKHCVVEMEEFSRA